MLPTYNVDKVDELAIFYYLLENTDHPIGLRDIPFMDVAIQGFKQYPAKITRGKKNEKLYKLDFQTESGIEEKTVVKKVFNYTYLGDTNQIQSFTRKLQWLKNDGTVGIEKDITKIYDVFSIHKLNMVIWENQINYLIGAGKAFEMIALSNPYGFPQAVIDDLLFFVSKIGIIFDKYNLEIASYKNTGSTDLFTAIENETQADLVQAYNIIDPTNPLGWSMGKTMLNEFVPDSFDTNNLKDSW